MLTAPVPWNSTLSLEIHRELTKANSLPSSKNVRMFTMAQAVTFYKLCWRSQYIGSEIGTVVAELNIIYSYLNRKQANKYLLWSKNGIHSLGHLKFIILNKTGKIKVQNIKNTWLLIVVKAKLKLKIVWFLWKGLFVSRFSIFLLLKYVHS